MKKLIILSLLLFSYGCSTTDRDSLRSSGSETHAFNMARLDAEIAHAQQPLVRFEASPEALQVLAASGEPLILVVNNPYLNISRPEAPWWHRLVPTFAEAGNVALGGYSIYTARQNQKDANQANRELTQNVFGLIPPPGAGEE